MKRTCVVIFLVAGIIGFASAQTISISGTVKTADGDALHLAFVQDKQYKNGAYTDSLGSFSLAVNPNSKLKVSCWGFRDTLIDINNQTTFAIVLKPTVNIVASRSNITPQADDHNNINMATFSAGTVRDEPSVPNHLETYSYQASPTHKVTVTLTSGSFDMAQGAVFPVFTHKEATQGSRYLFDDWVHGYVVTAADSVIQNPVLFFNYDKIGGGLLLTKDKHAAIEVYRENVKSFTLFDALNQPLTFAPVPEIDKTHYVQVIASGNNYKIYKTIKTKFIASNYESDGLASTGNNFDLYQDEFDYYILNVKTNQLQKIGLKKKVLKQAFAADGTKADGYFKTNDGDIDDNYLASLGDYMNK
jgi:hypothetical protein